MPVFRTLLVGVIAASIAFIASSASARDIWPPPARYDSGPLMNAQYQTPIIEHLSPAKLDAACFGKHLACSFADVGEPCEIFLPITGWQPMLRHEMGHCRGWPANHPS